MLPFSFATLLRMVHAEAVRPSGAVSAVITVRSGRRLPISFPSTCIQPDLTSATRSPPSLPVIG